MDCFAHPDQKNRGHISLLIGAAYLALSGGSVATERAYIMVAVMLVAVLLDRRALTLRAVAMAATIVLIIQPEALVGPGFQMSFAATTALVLVFGQMRHFNTQRLPKWARCALGGAFLCGGRVCDGSLCRHPFQYVRTLRPHREPVECAADGPRRYVGRRFGGVLCTDWLMGCRALGDGKGVALDPLCG